MTLAIKPELERLIQERMESGGYRTPEDVITAALHALDRDERLGEFEPGEMDRLIDEGENSGPALDGEQVFAELRAMRSRHRESQR